MVLCFIQSSRETRDQAMGIAARAKAHRAKTLVREDAVAPPDESCTAKSWRHFEVLLVRARFSCALALSTESLTFFVFSRHLHRGSWPQYLAHLVGKAFNDGVHVSSDP